MKLFTVKIIYICADIQTSENKGNKIYGVKQTNKSVFTFIKEQGSDLTTKNEAWNFSASLFMQNVVIYQKVWREFSSNIVA